MACFICENNLARPESSDAVGTCMTCSVHACNDHGDRPPRKSFQCAICLAWIVYAGLARRAGALVPLAPKQPDDPGDDVPAARRSQIWRHSRPWRQHWRSRIDEVLQRALGDPNSPWRRSGMDASAVFEDREVRRLLADLVGIVAWYLGLGIGSPFPSSPRQNHTFWDDDDLLRILAELRRAVQITPLEVLYLLRYYPETLDPGDTDPGWDLSGVLELPWADR